MKLFFPVILLILLGSMITKGNLQIGRMVLLMEPFQVIFKGKYRRSLCKRGGGVKIIKITFKNRFLARL